MALHGAHDPFQSGSVIPGTRYRTLGRLGAGGMSAVYEVEHIELGRRFVLKVLLDDLRGREDLAQRVRNEWRALGRLRHPNIVAVTDAGETESGLPYFVMEHLEGETLQQRLARRRSLTVPEALEIACELLFALGAAHTIGIVHRDVKPANILLPKHAPLKLLDFGIAKLVRHSDGNITRAGVALGTPRYMSPEQALGQTLDGRSDLYGVGLVLFEMVAGRCALDRAHGVAEVLALHQLGTSPVLTRFVPGVAPELAELVSRLLEKNPAERPATAAAVVEAILPLRARYERVLSTTQVTAHYTMRSIPPWARRAQSDAVGDHLPAKCRSMIALPLPTQTVAGMPWTLLGADAAGTSLPALSPPSTAKLAREPARKLQGPHALGRNLALFAIERHVAPRTTPIRRARRAWLPRLGARLGRLVPVLPVALISLAIGAVSGCLVRALAAPLERDVRLAEPVQAAMEESRERVAPPPAALPPRRHTPVPLAASLERALEARTERKEPPHGGDAARPLAAGSAIATACEAAWHSSEQAAAHAAQAPLGGIWAAALGAPEARGAARQGKSAVPKREQPGSIDVPR